MIYVVVIYIVSVMLGWLYVHLVYSKNGIESNNNPDLGDLLLCIVPGINTLAVLVAWIFHFPLNIDHIDTSKLFKIKK